MCVEMFAIGASAEEVEHCAFVQQSAWRHRSLQRDGHWHFSQRPVRIADKPAVGIDQHGDAITVVMVMWHRAMTLQ